MWLHIDKIKMFKSILKLSQAEVEKLFVNGSHKLRWSFLLITVPYLYGFLFHLLKIFYPLSGRIGRTLQTVKNFMAFVTLGGSAFFYVISDIPTTRVCTCSDTIPMDDNTHD
jgi:hypothetical protein